MNVLKKLIYVRYKLIVVFEFVTISKQKCPEISGHFFKSMLGLEQSVYFGVDSVNYVS